MIKITLITLGKLKEKYLRDASGEYEKRLSRYCDLEIIEIAPCNLSENPSESEISSALEKEAEQIIKKIPQNAETFALCVEGVQKSSPDFAKQLGDLSKDGKRLCFIIGSSYGLSQRVKSLCRNKLSLSKMTFPHQLFRIMMLEQIYRAFKINEGSTYHK